MATEVAVDALEGTTWTLVELPPDNLIERVTLTLAFEGGRVGGTDGCNRFRGSYSTEGDGLRIGQLAGTMMACPEPVMQQGRRFTTALDSARGATLDGDALVLVDGNGETVARFEAQAQFIADSRWHVTGYNNGRQAVVGTARETSLSLEFDAAGTVTGSAGCNSFRASYRGDGGLLDIGPPAAGRRVCDEAVMAQESAFFEALGRSAALRIEGDRLELRDDQGALQITARRAE
jgi:heat shock protein HslJ